MIMPFPSFERLSVPKNTNATFFGLEEVFIFKEKVYFFPVGRSSTLKEVKQNSSRVVLWSTSSKRKKWCITKKAINSFSNLGNGMCQITFFSTLDIYGVKNRLIRLDFAISQVLRSKQNK